MKGKNRNSSLGILALIVLTFLFASMGVFSRYFNHNFHLFQQTYIRMFSAFLLGLILFKGSLDFKKLLKISLGEWCLLLFRSVANYIGGVILFTLAVFNTTLANVSLIQSLPLVAVFGFIFLGEKITIRKIILILLAFVGVFLITAKGGLQVNHLGIGELYALAAAVSFSIGYVARRWHTSTLNNKEITEVMLGIATLLLFGCSLLWKEGLPLTGWSGDVFFVYVISGLFNVGGLFLTNYGFQHVKAVLASNLLTLEALFGLLLGFIFYREFPQLQNIIGGILIICSVLFFNQEEFK